LQADLLGCPVDRPAVLETTALGVALIAGMESGFYADAAAVAAARRVERTFEPRMDDADRAARLALWQDAVSRSRGWARGRTPSATG
jgi:glycerol kinase